MIRMTNMAVQLFPETKAMSSPARESGQRNLWHGKAKYSFPVLQLMADTRHGPYRDAPPPVGDMP